MFKRPKVEEVGAAPDPADVANRRETERRRRIGSGGRQATVLAQSVRTAAAPPTATLTGTKG